MYQAVHMGVFKKVEQVPSMDGPPYHASVPCPTTSTPIQLIRSSHPPLATTPPRPPPPPPSNPYNFCTIVAHVL